MSPWQSFPGTGNHALDELAYTFDQSWINPWRDMPPCPHYHNPDLLTTEPAAALARAQQDQMWYLECDYRCRYIFLAVEARIMCDGLDAGVAAYCARLDAAVALAAKNKRHRCPGRDHRPLWCWRDILHDELPVVMIAMKKRRMRRACEAEKKRIKKEFRRHVGDMDRMFDKLFKAADKLWWREWRDLETTALFWGPCAPVLEELRRVEKGPTLDFPIRHGLPSVAMWPIVARSSQGQDKRKASI